MSDTFLPGSGFDTYEQQDKVLVGLGGGTAAKVAVRILQQQGFAVAGAVVKLSAEEEPLVQSAKEAAKALGIECATLNAEALAAQGVPPVDARLSALLTAADKLGIQYIATGTLPRWRPGPTASAISTRRKTLPRTRAMLLPPCRRISWPGSSCRWGPSPRRMCRRWPRILTFDAHKKALGLAIQSLCFFID